VRAGDRAAARVRARGLRAADIGCVPAAAGGPKGLALIPLDLRLFGAGGWLREATLDLVGASIGAWRMTCAAQVDAADALRRLADAYVGQRYSRRPTSEECRRRPGVGRRDRHRIRRPLPFAVTGIALAHLPLGVGGDPPLSDVR